MRSYWVGLLAGAFFVGIGVLIGVEISNAPDPAPVEHTQTTDAVEAAAQTQAGTVRITGAQSNAGWIIYFHLPERARQVEYRRGDDGAWIALGPNPHDVDLATGKPRSKTYAMLADLAGPTTFAVRYTADDGEVRGPYAVPFDPTAESVRALESLLDDLPRWVETRDYDGKRLAYFTTLLVYKPAIEAIRYGVNRQSADTAVRFRASNTLGIDPDDQMYVELPRGAREIVVEVTLRGGKTVRQTVPVVDRGP